MTARCFGTRSIVSALPCSAPVQVHLGHREAGSNPGIARPIKPQHHFVDGLSAVSRGFEYVYRDMKDDVLLASIAGGTDIISACGRLPGDLSTQAKSSVRAWYGG